MSYYDEARTRATRRKSAWNICLIPAVGGFLFALWWSARQILELVHLHFYPEQTFSNSSHGIGVLLSGISPLLGALPLAMIFANFLIWSIPPARRALDKEATPFPSTSFTNAQKQLLKAALFLVPITIILSITGALLPWHP